MKKLIIGFIAYASIMFGGSAVALGLGGGGISGGGVNISGAQNVTGDKEFSGNLNATGTLQIGGVTVTPTAAELNYVNGVTSAIQTQFSGKVGTTGNETIAGNKTFSGTTSLDNATANRSSIVIKNSGISGKY